MCLAVPGEVVATSDEHGLRYATVRFGAVERQVCVHAFPDVAPGDFVLVHVGFAIARLDAEQAARTLATLEELGALEEGAAS